MKQFVAKFTRKLGKGTSPVPHGTAASLAVDNKAFYIKCLPVAALMLCLCSTQAMAFTVNDQALFKQVWDLFLSLTEGAIGALMAAIMFLGALVTVAMTGRLLIPCILVLAAATIVFLEDIMTGLGFTLDFGAIQAAVTPLIM